MQEMASSKESIHSKSMKTKFIKNCGQNLMSDSFELPWIFERNWEVSASSAELMIPAWHQLWHYVKKDILHGDEDRIANDAARSKMLIFKTRHSAATYFPPRSWSNNAENHTQAASRPGRLDWLANLSFHESAILYVVGRNLTGSADMPCALFHFYLFRAACFQILIHITSTLITC